MKARDVFGYSFNAIKLRKLRAGLTTLGVVIGIAAIVALLSITQGLQATITDQLQQGLSANSLIVYAGSNGMFGSGTSGGGIGGGDGSDFGVGDSSGFSLFVNYTDEIKELSPEIESVFAVIQRSGYVQSESLNRSVTIYGVNFSDYSQAYTTFVAESGIIPLNPSENETVIGTRISSPSQNETVFITPGDNISIAWLNASVLPFKNETYLVQVSGVLQKIGGFGIGGPSDTGVYIPLEKAMSFFDTEKCDMIIVKLKNAENDIITDVTNAITNHFSDQVSVISSTAVLSLLSRIFNTIQLFLAGIAAISLLVAGIGIMNIMIVSLMERTREIGILKALGMKSRTVLAIFLSESIIIGLLGGIIGVALGWSLANVIATLFSSGGPLSSSFGGNAGLSITPMLQPELIAGAVGFGVVVSVVFALYPAWRASKLKPVEALRYE